MASKKHFRFDNVRLARRLMDDGHVDEVIAHLLQVTAQDRPSRRVAAFAAVRTRILRTDEYKHPDFEARVRALMAHEDLTDHDRQRLLDLLGSPLRTIRWAQTNRSLGFDSRELYQRFREIPSVQDPFYQFVVPPELMDQARQDRQKRIAEDHRHHTKPSPNYHFSDKEVAEMVVQAREWCESDHDWTKRIYSMQLLEALGLLTGRRKWELCSTLKMRSVPGNEYQAEVRGIAKKLMDMQWRRIPLLAPLSVVVRAMVHVRVYPHRQGDYGSCRRLFPRLTHTRYRDLYARLCYQERDKNQFYPDSCSELWWKSQALCNDLLTFTKHYTTLVLDVDRHASSEPRLPPIQEDALADPSRESWQHGTQDPV